MHFLTLYSSPAESAASNKKHEYKLARSNFRLEIREFPVSELWASGTVFHRINEGKNKLTKYLKDELRLMDGAV